MIRFRLYHTAGCHLCEKAEALLRPCLASAGVAETAWEKIDIADDPQLLERYGWSIPVLRCLASGRELNWPFGPQEIQAIL
ncbi:MAG: glutaredoxin family protein [Methylococcaceae bacterium]|nr:glutaredoxin family protein [Methylococcaceae bacterium]